MTLLHQTLVALLVSSFSLQALADTDECDTYLSPDEQTNKILTVNLAGAGVITTWGIIKWDYFTNSPQSRSEKWFQNDTKSGGADKLGHMYTSYVTSHGLSALYEHWCFPREDAALFGALSGLAITGFIEIGDAFSDFGFSKEDLAVNTLGSILAYYTYLDPELSNLLDYRWEYGTDPESDDFTTDYENSKYLFALKLNGFDVLKTNFLKHFELQLGYYTRGFSNINETRERNAFVGIGLNLTDLFGRHGYKKTSTFLKYFQVPGSNAEFDKDLNQ